MSPHIPDAAPEPGDVPSKAPVADPPALRLPRHLLSALAQPLKSEEDVHRLMAQIRVAEYRGLL